ncbi:MAG: hypothetical protein ABW167_19565 [Baekduia sp.]
MRRIQYDNFTTAVEERDVEVMDPQTKQRGVMNMRVLVLMDVDGATIHEFAYPPEHAARLGEELGASPKPKVARATPADLAKLPDPLRRGGRTVGG